ncbi:unnamed protein product [Pedinophyceae sp. YPF-701]|nr:unnamed protein product [Pedinophyceae sp. YPF-701]
MIREPTCAKPHQTLQEQVSGVISTFGKAAFALTTSLVIVATGAILPSPGDQALAANLLSPEEKRTVSIFERGTKSVVYVSSLARKRDTFTLDLREIPDGVGSGFIWDDEGHVITNYHVVREADDVAVTIGSGGVTQQLQAKVVGVDSDKDIAVLDIERPDDISLVKPIPVGSSSDLVVGQKVYAIGNPFGLDHTLTTGVISGLNREISSGINGRPIQDVIQTDAAINPGNSGGPLLDSQGKIIGVNTAIYSASGASAGVGFAIPIDVVKNSVEQIISMGIVVRPIIGITFAPDPATEELGIQGILVLKCQPGGPAAKAGIRPTTRDDYGRLNLGDIILSVDGKKVRKAADLFRSLNNSKVGDTIDLEVLRSESKEPTHIQLELGGRPAQ